MFYMIGARVLVNGVALFRVLEVATCEAGRLEAMAAYSSLYTGAASRVATAQEYADYSNGLALEFGI